MKPLFTLLLLTIVSFQSIAQNEFKNTFGLAAGFTLFGKDDIKGYNFMPKYERQLNKLISFQAQLNFANAQPQSSEPSWGLDHNSYTMSYLQSSSQKLHLGLLVGLLKSQSHFIGFNALAGLVRSRQFQYGGYSLSTSSNFPDDIEYISTPPFYQKEITADVEGAYQQYNGHTESRVNLGLYYSFNRL